MTKSGHRRAIFAVRLMRLGLCAFVLGLTILPVRAARVYPNGLPTDPGFFPIGVWTQSPSLAPAYAAIGINTYVGLWDGPTEEQLDQLAKHQMHVLALQNEIALHSPHGDMIRGWTLPDEPDNAQPLGPDKWGPCIPAATVAQMTRDLKKTDPTRPVYLGFGRGVADTGWVGRGSCTGDTAYYDRAIAGADILAFDIYPVANSVEHQGRLDYVGIGTANLKRRAAPDQSVWTVIETTSIQSHNRVTPEQLKDEVWMALIHGARGIVYFVSEWTGGYREDAVFRYPEIVAAARSIDATIAQLAPVLNSPDVPGKVAVASMAPLATMVKQQGATTYLFAIAMNNVADNVAFAVKGFGNGTATVIGENRTIRIVDGWFKDDFAGYATHAYAITAAP